MAILKLSPTRGVLLDLKKRLKNAIRGHKLLKDKRDGLMKEFMSIIREARELRTHVSHDIERMFKHYLRASATTPKRVLDTALMVSNAKLELNVSVKNVMSVPLPCFTTKKEGTIFSYGFLGTSGELDKSVEYLDDLFEKLVRLAQLEKSAEALAIEIEKTRRRVSALENIMIPNLKETTRFISGRLEEQARDSIVSTMRVKAMIESRERGLTA